MLLKKLKEKEISFKVMGNEIMFFKYDDDGDEEELCTYVDLPIGFTIHLEKPLHIEIVELVHEVAKRLTTKEFKL